MPQDVYSETITIEQLKEVKKLTQRVDELLNKVTPEYFADVEPYRSKREILKYLSVSENTFRKFLTQGLPVRKIGHHLRGKLSEIDKWIEQNNK